MKKLIEKIKSYFKKVIVIIPDGRNEDGTLKNRCFKVSKRKIKKLFKKTTKIEMTHEDCRKFCEWADKKYSEIITDKR